MHFTAEIWVSLVLIATNMCAKNGYCILSPQWSCSYMTGLHMLLAATAASFVRNVMGFWPFCLRIQVLLRLVKFSHGLSRRPWGAVKRKGLLSPGGSKAHCSARGLPRIPVYVPSGPSRSNGVLHVRFSRSNRDLLRFHVLPRLRMKRERRAALEQVCAHGIKRRPRKQ